MRLEADETGTVRARLLAKEGEQGVVEADARRPVREPFAGLQEPPFREQPPTQEKPFGDLVGTLAARLVERRAADRPTQIRPWRSRITAPRFPWLSGRPSSWLKLVTR